MNKEKLYTTEDMFTAIQYIRTHDKMGKSILDLRKEIDHHLDTANITNKPIVFLGSDKNTTEHHSYEITYKHADGSEETIHVLYTEEVYETQGVYEITREEFSYSNGFDKRVSLKELNKIESIIYQEIKSSLPF